MEGGTKLSLGQIMTRHARYGRKSYETVLKLPFRRGSFVGDTKLNLIPDHDPRYTKWMKSQFLCRRHKTELMAR